MGLSKIDPLGHMAFPSKKYYGDHGFAISVQFLSSLVSLKHSPSLFSTHTTWSGHNALPITLLYITLN